MDLYNISFTKQQGLLMETNKHGKFCMVRSDQVG